MDWSYIASTTWLLLLIMDPFANLPIFTMMLKDYSPQRAQKILLRESCMALGIMVLALLTGPYLMQLMGLGHGTLGMTGGLILLLISIKMVFGTVGMQGSENQHEPFIVPMAVPMIAGPALVAMLLIRLADSNASLLDCGISLLLAWVIQTVILLLGRKVVALVGSRVLNAAESLVGLLLASIAIQMLVNGIKTTFGLS